MSRAPIPDPALFSSSRTDHLRVTDVDFQGHVNNTVFALFYASARYDFLGAHIRPHLEGGAKLVVAATTINYTAEMHYGAPVETITRIASLGRTSLQMEQIILQDGRICSHSTTTMVHRDAVGAVAWPEPVRAFVAA